MVDRKRYETSFLTASFPHLLCVRGSTGALVQEVYNYLADAAEGDFGSEVWF